MGNTNKNNKKGLTQRLKSKSKKLKNKNAKKKQPYF